MASGLGPLDEALAAGGRLFGICLEILADRLELLGLEARAAKVRLAQCLILACAGAAFLVVGLGLAGVAVLLAVPPPWRAGVAAGVAVVCLVAGAGAFWRLRRRLARLPRVFSQTAAELRKDRECF
ncbi:phage holin family protein [Solidesulfovibrio sp. C21]|uniref:phage holin family protein n=1 Tax=Solidesulfovibrio sp. C21 TaxID=3398613 RepID=UPI0039FBA391